MALAILGFLIALLVFAGCFTLWNSRGAGDGGFAAIMIAFLAWGGALILSIVWIGLALYRWAP